MTATALPAPSGSPADVIFHARVVDDTGQWGIGILDETGALEVRTGSVAPGETFTDTRADAVVAGFAAVMDAASARQYVTLDVSHPILREAISSMLDLVPTIMLSATTAIGVHRSAVVAAMDDMPVPEAEVRLNPAAVSLVLSTDASIAHGGKVAGLGWVISGTDGSVLSCGQRADTVARCGDILTGELLAIRWGLQSVISRHPVPAPEQGTVTIESDSRDALRILRTLAAGRVPRTCTAEQLKLARKILDESAHMPVVYRWVKGHNGNTMNESADRLAVLARRNSEFGVTAEVSQKMFRDLREDLAAA